MDPKTVQDKGSAQYGSTTPAAPELAQQAVLVKAVPLPKGTPICKGHDFNKSRDLDSVMESMKTVGFQATNLGKACNEVDRMLRWRLSDEDAKEHSKKTLEERKNTKATIFFGFTSNQVSSGNREVIRYLCQHNMVDVIVTTCGAIEEDIMKCMAPHYMGAFDLKGSVLRKKGQNRIGNLIVPNSNYVKFEDWISPVLKQMYKEQIEEGRVWSPSQMIRRFGKVIDNEESIWYWCYKNNIPVYCPSITDGSVGDMMFFQSYNDPGFICDITQDIRMLNATAMHAEKTGMIILGGGLIKHHICNANLMRNGADFSVFINTGQEYDGSDSGARPDEAVSWGKIKMTAKPVKVYGDATAFFPLVVSQTFAKYPTIAARNPRKHKKYSSYIQKVVRIKTTIADL